jgi:hypothetical protein
MTRRNPAAAALVAAVLAAGTVTPALAEGDPLAEARNAVTRLSFSATVTVQWLDGAGTHHIGLALHSDRGRVRVDGPGSQEVLWSSGTALLDLPPASRKYQVRTAEGPAVVGRPTTSVDILSGGALRERFAVDRDTGLVLQRVQYDDLNRAVRVVRVESLSLVPPSQSNAAAPGPVPAPATGLQGLQGRRVAAAALPNRYRVPAQLADGYTRVGTYVRGHIAHALYSDGLHGLSLFAQPGTLDLESLPPGAGQVRAGDRTVFVYGWPGGEAVTWSARGVVYTLVGDGPVEEVLSAALTLPRPPAPSMLSRVRQRARSVAELVLGGVG